MYNYFTCDYFMCTYKNSYLYSCLLILVLYTPKVKAEVKTERNPFCYGPVCMQTPYCEVLAFGSINNLPIALVSVNGIVQTLKIGDSVGTCSITAFEPEAIILQDFKSATQRIIALKKKPFNLK